MMVEVKPLIIIYNLSTQTFIKDKNSKHEYIFPNKFPIPESFNTKNFTPAF